VTARVAVTGIGAVTPVGNDCASTWSALVAGRSGIGPITTFPASTYPVRIAGLVKDFDVRHHLPDPRVARHLNRAGGFGAAATAQALADAAVGPDVYEPHERGISMGGTAGRPSLQDFAELFHLLDISQQHSYYRQTPLTGLMFDQNVALAAMAQLGDCQGPMLSISTACSASAHALGEAYRCIQDGGAKLMLAGGTDSLTTFLDVIGFSLLGALAKDFNDDPERASSPFDRDRSGFVLGEGSVVAVLEDWDTAVARGARIYAEILGYGSSMNAYRITDAPADGRGVDLAMEHALSDSGLAPAEIDYVVAHGTGTSGNDSSETAAIKTVFGDDAYKLAISSPKSMVGHLTCASGSLNLLAAVCAMRDGVVSPTINLRNPDPKLDLDYTPNVAKKMPVRAAMINAFAFGGTIASLVLRRPETS
jgi:3-oxoacyl-[acyl-carrier-protein] synthase II